MTEECSPASPDAAHRAGTLTRHLLRPTIGLAVSALFIWLAFRGLSITEIRAALANVDWSLTPLALVFLVAGYAGRITRWWVMLRPTTPQLRWWEAARPFLVSIAANNVLPLRIGDVLRLFAFHGRKGLEAGRVGGTLLLERLLDLFVLLGIFALVLPVVPAFENSASLARFAGLAAAAGAVALVILMLLAKFERLVLGRVGQWRLVRDSAIAAKAFHVFSVLVDTLVRLGRLQRMAILVLLSVFAWLMEGGVFLIAAQAVAVPLGFTGSYFALATATLSTLLPSSPGYVGTFHFFAMQAALAFGAPSASAVAFAILAHLLLWAPTTLAGLLAFVTATLKTRRDKSRLAPVA